MKLRLQSEKKNIFFDFFFLSFVVETFCTCYFVHQSDFWTISTLYNFHYYNGQHLIQFQASINLNFRMSAFQDAHILKALNWLQTNILETLIFCVKFFIIKMLFYWNYLERPNKSINIKNRRNVLNFDWETTHWPVDYIRLCNLHNLRWTNKPTNIQTINLKHLHAAQFIA